MKFSSSDDGITIAFTTLEARFLVREIGDLSSRDCGSRLRAVYRELFALLRARGGLDADEVPRPTDHRAYGRKLEPLPSETTQYRGDWKGKK